MTLPNTTVEATFILLGFGKRQSAISVFIMFLIFFITYIATLCGNLTIISLVLNSHQLQTPMYTLLMHLSICDVVFTTNIVPNILHSILEGVIRIPIETCVSHFYVYGVSATTKCLTLMAMCYDRYLDICKPLHYNAIMNLGLCVKLVGLSWLSGGLTTLNTALIIFMQPFCCPKIIDHFICDVGPLLKLSCSDLSFLQFLLYVISIPFLITPFVFIIVTYICIFITIIYIVPMVMRLPNRGQVISTNKVLFLLYTVTPLFNPFIYNTRNQEIWKAAENVLLEKEETLTFYTIWSPSSTKSCLCLL